MSVKSREKAASATRDLVDTLVVVCCSSMTGAEILKAEAARFAVLSRKEQDKEMAMQVSRSCELLRRDALMELPVLRTDKPKGGWGERKKDETSSPSISFSPLIA
jgi:hypothetical protein